jgi:hypothetical protein
VEQWSSTDDVRLKAHLASRVGEIEYETSPRVSRKGVIVGSTEADDVEILNRQEIRSTHEFETETY